MLSFVNTTAKQNRMEQITDDIEIIEVGEMGSCSETSSLLQQHLASSFQTTAASASDGRSSTASDKWSTTSEGRSSTSTIFNGKWWFSEHGRGDHEFEYAAIKTLPPTVQLRTSLSYRNYLSSTKDNTGRNIAVVDIKELRDAERHLFVDNLLKKIENDNHRLLRKVSERLNRVGLGFPTVEVRFKNLRVKAEYLPHEESTPTLWNVLKSIFSVTGDISYNGYKLNEFLPQKTSAYISQYDVHISEMTVRETLDFSACCQGIGSGSEIMMEIIRREKEAGIIPDPVLDTYMKATAIEGLNKTLRTDYILKILGLENSADTIVGDAMTTGISGGQKRRLTTGEMIIGPIKVLLMDEISNGLDSSTTFQIVTCLQQWTHATRSTTLLSLLQPAPEIFDLFDDLILMAEGKIAYQGPRDNVIEFFEHCGFRCPPRKGIADFLQEVVSRKDQEQYWYHTNQAYNYISVKDFRNEFKKFHVGRKLDKELSQDFIRSDFYKNALSFNVYSLRKWELFKACMAREWLFMRRNSFVHIVKSAQESMDPCANLVITASLPTWLKWGFWVSPLAYAEVGASINEFLAPRWQKVSPSNATIGNEVLMMHGLNYSDFFYWISVGALIGFWLIFNIGFTFSLSYSKSPGKSRTIVSHKKSLEEQLHFASANASAKEKKKGLVLSFEPMMITFNNVQYFINAPKKTGEHESKTERVQLLKDITGTFRDGVLTALMGASGAGKTTLMDVLSGRKTGGIIEGDIRIGGYPKVQDTYARISGYCEQSDIHSPQVTIHESLTYSAWLRLPPEIDQNTKSIILMKRGGQIIYSGELGKHSNKLIEYFEAIPGVPKIRENYNPATWMLEVTSPSAEAQLGLNFARVYDKSSLCRNTKELVRILSIPAKGSAELSFSTSFPQNGWEQFKACLWKQNLSYWRSPKYNIVRLVFITMVSMCLGTVFWQKGREINSEQDLFNIAGAIFIFLQFSGIGNCSSVISFIATERPVMYRERFAGMYSSWAYSFAQVTIEIPYVFFQALLFVLITYPTIGFYWSISKVLWYMYMMFCTMLYFTYIGMLLVALTPKVQLASILASFCYTVTNLFAGFLVPGPNIPKWWVWFYWICPMSWSLEGILTSQYGDIEREISAFGRQKTLNAFLESYYGYHLHHLGVAALVLFAFPLVFATCFAYAIAKLNFQRR
ncbi:hypothetical protein RHMOL_Rhmol08G0090300 [Rhododendron molle]|uniref:Uncharacterized protein n=1 Tax=Rhododendron molle TaxID=49168 RepID=A0ACC0ML68_RHOML|nr:hypothetical protein RHMOL_Rhmol08G0090300 [Rhododendron molle]